MHYLDRFSCENAFEWEGDSVSIISYSQHTHGYGKTILYFNYLKINNQINYFEGIVSLVVTIISGLLNDHAVSTRRKTKVKLKF